MAKLAAGMKESDAFPANQFAKLSFQEKSPDRLERVKGALRAMGIIVDDISGDPVTLFDLLLGCGTYGDVVRALPLPLKGAQTVESLVEVQQNMWERDMKAAKLAWEKQFVVSDTVLNYVASRLGKYASEWDKEHWYAPLVAMVQSSGWGKSRLMCQLWRRGFYVFYISCMGEKQTGYPRRTGKLARILVDPESTELTFAALLLGIFTVLKRHVSGGMTCEQWMQAQERSDVIEEKNVRLREEVYEAYEDQLGKLKNELQKASGQKWDREVQCGSIMKDLISGLDEWKVQLILCVDEAGELDQNFVKLRRSLRSVPKGSGFISVVLGTDRRVADLAYQVADLAAAEEDDPSARVRLATRLKVYHPLYLIGKSDMLVKIGTDSSPVGIAREDVLRFGRPLWAAYYDSVEETDKLNATISLGMTKLLGKNTNLAEPGWVTCDVAVAVFACIVGLDVVAWGTLPHQLVAKHMRTIVHIREDRRRVYTAAAAEPVLAAAAAKLLHAEDDKHLCLFLDRLIEVFSDGLVLEGVRGEVVVRIIIMLAIHQCTKSQNYLQSVTLGSFLRVMFGPSKVVELDTTDCDLEEAHVFFNCFSPVTAEPHKRLIEDAFARCTALVARRNEKSIDLFMPTRCPKLSSDTKGVAVPVQVKNQSRRSKMKQEVGMLQEEGRVTAPVQLFFQVGHTGPSNIRVDKATVVAFGIDCFEHLKSNQPVVNRLKLLCRTCETVFKGISIEEKRILRDMIPLGVASQASSEDMEDSAFALRMNLPQSQQPDVVAGTAPPMKCPRTQ